MTYIRKRPRWYWTPEEEAELLRRRAAGETSPAIGARMARSGKAVKLHALAMGLPPAKPGRRADQVFDGATDKDIATAEELAERKRLEDEAKRAVQGEKVGNAIGKHRP